MIVEWPGRGGGARGTGTSRATGAGMTASGRGWVQLVCREKARETLAEAAANDRRGATRLPRRRPPGAAGRRAGAGDAVSSESRPAAFWRVRARAPGRPLRLRGAERARTRSARPERGRAGIVRASQRASWRAARGRAGRPAAKRARSVRPRTSASRARLRVERRVQSSTGRAVESLSG